MIFLFDDANEPKDIFAEIPSEKPVERQPVPPMPRPGLPAEASAQAGVVIERTPFSKKWIIIPLVIVLLGGLGYGAWRLFFRPAPSTNIDSPFNDAGFSKNQPAEQPQPEPTPPPPAPTPEAVTTTEAATTTPEAPEPPSPATLDSDGDGLTDEQEINTYHTYPNNPDTDNDGLTDREEAIVYKTDPNNPDTDGDTYLDGAEVKAGYNPLGPGKLQQLP